MTAPMTDWHRINPREIDSRLREMLRGRRLVGELDLSPNGEVFQMAQQGFIKIIRHGDFRRLTYVPAVTVVFLVGEGGRCYDEGTFWPNIGLLQTATPQDISKVGKAFESSVQGLGLEDFSQTAEEGGWLRYVSPILLHGGIPTSCAQDAAELVLSNVRNGIQDAAELIDGAMRHSMRRTQMTKPLQRFFLHGGEFALDLVQRMITAILEVNVIGHQIAGESVSEMAEDLGLPRYLLDALIEIFSEGGSLDQTVFSRRSARPQVQIDPYSCNGPYLILPPVNGGGEWLLTGTAANRYKALRHDSHEVALTPSRDGWSVTLRQEADGSRARFSGHQDVAAYIFDIGGRLARDQQRLKGDGALLLVAKDVEVTRDDNMPVVLAEEDLPPRSEPWQGWKLLNIDISEGNFINLHMSSVGSSMPSRLPVLRPPKGPSITSEPLTAVRGPSNCLVYADPPSVTEPHGTAASAWRVRWRGDESVTPSTTILDCLPCGPLGRDLAPRLPLDNAFLGTVEVVGPLGSDLREHIAVVRGLRVALPDRVVGPDETVEATVSADCDLSSSDGTNGRSLVIVFEPGCDSIEISADSLQLTVTIPRLAWTVNHQGVLPAPFSGDPQQIGLDEIESGEAESLMVRCGRSARVFVELHGHELLQRAEPVQAAGEQGRWAFPLSQFCDTLSVSGMSRMNLHLCADDVKAKAVNIVARYEISELQVEALSDTDRCEALLAARWSENRRFRDRQFRLWSQHRLWEPPICANIPDTVGESFDCVFTGVPPGPYLAQIALRDDWTRPKRPASDSTDVVKVIVGSPEDVNVRFLSLRPTVPLESLELVVSGHLNSTLVDTGPLAEMLTDDLIWSLPQDSLLKLALTLMPVSGRCMTDSNTMEMLWETGLVVAAVFDRELDDYSTVRWKRFTGWLPDDNGPKQPQQPVSEPLDRFEPDRLDALADALPPMGSMLLEFGGYTIAALEMLKNTWPDRTQLSRWMSTHTRITTYTQRFSLAQRQQIKALSPTDCSPGWHKFPARLLAAAFQTTDDYASQTDRNAAEQALFEASKIAPLLTKRNLLTAIGMQAASLC